MIVSMASWNARALIFLAMSAVALPQAVRADPGDAVSSAQRYWNGIYVGVHAGGLQTSSDWNYPATAINSVAVDPVVGYTAGSSGRNSSSGWLTGFQVGYNHPFGNWVLGAESNFSLTRLKAAHGDSTFANTNRETTSLVASLAARAGYVSDRSLFFAKAGLAWSGNQYAVASARNYLAGEVPDAVQVTTGSIENKAGLNRFGLLLGAGVEYAIAPNWSLKGEYNFIDWGSSRIAFAPAAAGMTPFEQDIRQRNHLFLLGLNYHLGQPNSPINTAVAEKPGLFAGVEYLRWQAKAAPLSVPLVATSEVNDEGLLLDSNTTILYGAPFAPAVGGSDEQKFKQLSGIRLTVGYAPKEKDGLSFEGSGFLMQRRSAGYFAQGDANGSPGMRVPVYTRPYLPEGQCSPGSLFCAVPQGEDGVPIAIPGDVTGSVAVSNTLRFWGLNADAVARLYNTPSWNLSAIAGIRHLSLTERFSLAVNLQGVAGTEFEGQSGTVTDTFDTRNQFYGATLGLRNTFNHGPFFMEATGRVSLGVNHETLGIAGSYVAQNFLTQSGPYGIFAMPSNEGTTTRNAFAVNPEFQAKIGYRIAPGTELFLGYNFLYLSNVIRPTDQISRDIQKGQTFQQDSSILGSAFPMPVRLFRSTDYWERGLSVGLTSRF